MRSWTRIDGVTRSRVGRMPSDPGIGTCVDLCLYSHTMLRLGTAFTHATETCNTLTYWLRGTYLYGWARARVWLREEMTGLWRGFWGGA